MEGLKETLLNSIISAFQIECNERQIDSEITNYLPKKENGWLWVQFGSTYIRMKTDKDNAANILKTGFSKVYKDMDDASDGGIVAKVLLKQLKKTQENLIDKMQNLEL